MSSPRAWTRLSIIVVLVATATAVFAAAFPATLRLPRRDPHRAPGVPPALFSHRGHAALGCQACHPAFFPQEPVAFIHDDMKAGKYCAACHDGGTAFAIVGAACGGCHAPGG